MKRYVIKVEDWYVYKKVNRWTMATRTDVNEAKQFNTLNMAKKYIDGWYQDRNIEFIEIEIK